MLHCRPQGMLDAAAVERRNGLKFIECNRQSPASRFGNAAGEREYLLREPRHVLASPGGGKGEGELARPLFIGLDSYLRPNAAEHVAEPGAGLVDSCFDTK